MKARVQIAKSGFVPSIYSINADCISDMVYTITPLGITAPISTEELSAVTKALSDSERDKALKEFSKFPEIFKHISTITERITLYKNSLQNCSTNRNQTHQTQLTTTNQNETQVVYLNTYIDKDKHHAKHASGYTIESRAKAREHIVHRKAYINKAGEYVPAKTYIRNKGVPCTAKTVKVYKIS